MAISDELFIIALGMIFNYVLVYRKSKFFGNVIFIVMGVAIMSYSTGNQITIVGLIVLLGSIASTIYDAIDKVTVKHI